MSQGVRTRFHEVIKGDRSQDLPVSCRFSVGYAYDRARSMGMKGSPKDLHGSGVEYMVRISRDLDLDFMAMPHWWHGALVYSWPDSLFSRPGETGRAWTETVECKRDPDNPGRMVSVRTAVSPAGAITGISVVEAYQRWPVEYMIKTAKDLEVLEQRPDPGKLDTSGLERMGQSIGDDGVVLFTYPGIVEEAVCLRGVIQFCMDLIETPSFARRMLDIVHSHSMKAVAMLAKCQSIDAIVLNNSSLSMISPSMYVRYGEEYDRDLIRTIKASGKVAIYHNCGRVMPYLPSILRTEPDVLEPLVPPSESSWADADLSRVREAVGPDMVLMGGASPSLVANGSIADAEAEARRCLEQGTHKGGRYIPFFGGTVFEVNNPEPFRAFASCARAGLRA